MKRKRIFICLLALLFLLAAACTDTPAVSPELPAPDDGTADPAERSPRPCRKPTGALPI
jgi:hypothetical protein